MRFILFLTLVLFFTTTSAAQEFEFISQKRVIDDPSSHVEITQNGIYITDAVILNKYDYDLNLLSRNRTGALPSKLSISPNGEYISCIQFSNIDNVRSLQIDLYDKNINNLYKPWKDMGKRSNYGLIDVSNKGNIAISISKEGDTKEFVEGTSIPTHVYILDSIGNEMWEQQFNGLTDVSISEINFGILDIFYDKFYLYDLNGQFIFEIDNVKKGAVSSNGKTVVVLRESSIDKYDDKGNVLIRVDRTSQNNEMEINYDGSIIALFGDELLILDNNLNAIAISTPVEIQKGLVSISPSGDYFFVRLNRHDFNLLVYANIIQKIYPSQNEKLNTSTPTLKWKSNNALEYIIKIDGSEYITKNPEFIPSIKLSPGEHIWSVKRIGIDRKESSWSSESSFIILTNETMVTETTFVDNPFTFYIGAASIIMLSMLGRFIVRPYYKRAKVRRKMVLTSTDWCPHCNKFTGGANICPHCGKDTTEKVAYANKKYKKK